MTDAEDNAAVVRLWDLMWNEGKLAATEELVRGRYQLRTASTPKRRADPRDRDVAPAVRRVRARKPDESLFQPGRRNQPSAGCHDRSQP
jgi:hypothetical protein